METFAKMILAGHGTMGLWRDDIEAEIRKRAEATRGPNESSAQAFTRMITADERGRLFYKASKFTPVRIAPADPALMAPPDKKRKKKGARGEAMEKLAQELRAANPKLSDAQAFTKVFCDPKNAELREAVKAEEMGLL
jgi:hypothetical protein